MKNLDNLRPHITMRQLLAIVPQCRTTLRSAIIRKRTKVVEVNDVTLSQDRGALVVDVIIDGVMLGGFRSTRDLVSIS